MAAQVLSIVPAQNLAQSYTDRGFRVVRVAPKDKNAIRKNWGDGDAPSEFVDGENVGVVMGSVSGGLIDLDFDTLTTSRVALYTWPQEAPMYGRKSKPGGHLWVRCDAEITRKIFAIPGEHKSMQLEIRGKGHQSVVPGSVHPSGELIEWTREGKPPLLEKHEIELRAGFTAFVAVLIDRAWNDGVKDDLTMAFVGSCAHRDIPQELCEAGVRALCEIGGSSDADTKLAKVARIYSTVENNEDRHTPGWTRLCEILGDEKLAKTLNGWITPRGFRGAPGGGKILKSEEVVALYNKRLALHTRESSERRVLHIEYEPNQTVVTPHTMRSAADLCAGEFVEIRDEHGKNKLVTAFSYWRDNTHKNRRDVKGFHSIPWALDEPPRTETDPDFINTFSGWPLAAAAKMADPEAPGVKFVLDFIRKDICNGDENAVEYVLSWIAHILQKPYEKPGVALILAGPQGTGKSMLMRTVAALLPQDAALLTSAHEQVFGRFTIHLMSLLLLGAEEIVYGGNHRDDSALKDLITAQRLSYEAKGMTPFQAPNYTRFIIASNSIRPVSTQDGKRRYLFLSPSGEHVGNRAFWGKLSAYIADHSTKAGLARFFVERDIDLYDPYKLPSIEDTGHKALEAEVVKANDPFMAFLHEMLTQAGEDGRVMRSDDGQWNPYTGQKYAPGEYIPSVLHAEYAQFHGKLFRYSTPLTQDRFARGMKKVLGGAMSVVWRRTNDTNWRCYHINIPLAMESYAREMGFESWSAYAGEQEAAPKE